MNRIKNFIIIITLIIFLYIIAILPVTCIFKSVTGILCPACGMTRAFWSIMNFNFLQATYFNILSIPLFIFIFIIFSQVAIPTGLYNRNITALTPVGNKSFSNRVITSSIVSFEIT